MKKLVIEPLKRVGEISFGMTRDEVRKVWGEAISFMKTADDDSSTDDFGFCHVYYDANDRCEAVEVWDAEVYIADTRIYPIDMNEAEAVLVEYFDDIEADDEGFISIDYSIGITAPDEEMEGILIGKENYYVED